MSITTIVMFDNHDSKKSGVPSDAFDWSPARIEGPCWQQQRRRWWRGLRRWRSPWLVYYSWCSWRWRWWWWSIHVAVYRLLVVLLYPIRWQQPGLGLHHHCHYYLPQDYNNNNVNHHFESGQHCNCRHRPVHRHRHRHRPLPRRDRSNYDGNRV